MSTLENVAQSRSSASIGAKIAAAEARQIRELIQAGLFLNESDFVRDAIRHRLAEMKVIKCRDIDYESAKKEVAGYFKRRGEACPDEAAEDLELDFDLVIKLRACCSSMMPWRS